MADNNYIINPVETLQNVGGLTPIRERKERGRRRTQQQNKEHPESQADDSTEAKAEGGPVAGSDDGHSIDYCA